MPLNESDKNLFDLLKERAKVNPAKPYQEQSFAENGKNCRVLFSEFVGELADVSFVDETISARDGYPIPVRIFNNDLPDCTPVLVFYPACGYYIDFFEENAIACSRIAKHSDVRVVVVNHRLVPHCQLPTPMYDGYDVLKHIAMNADHYKIDPDKIFVGGMSSGGNCAAVVSNLARNDDQLNIHHQILFNGVYDFLQTNLDYRKYEEEDFLAQRAPYWHFMGRLGLSDEQLKSPLISPYYEPDLSGLPPTTIMVAEYDGIRSDSEAYYKKLKEAGNEVDRIILPGQTHQGILLRKTMSDGEDPAKVIADIIRKNK